MSNLTYVYVVKCRCNNSQIGYYIGTSSKNDVKVRWAEHARGKGSRFTQKFEPINFTCVGRFERKYAMKLENILTIYYMRKVGFRFCRGGDYLNMRFDCYQISQLKWWLPSALIPALKTGSLGHPDPDLYSF
jgi:predicted GIY-YIG superfamily endonuclease